MIDKLPNYLRSVLPMDYTDAISLLEELCKLQEKVKDNNDHNKLINRDKSNQHTINSITELETELNKRFKYNGEIGGDINDDFNNLESIGCWFYNGEIVNHKPNNVGKGFIINFNNSETISQWFIEYQTNKLFFRYKDSDIWSEWNGAVPTNVSSFTNDAEYLTLQTLPIYDGSVE